MRVAIIGNGWVGKAYQKIFKDAYIYDEPLKIGTREEVNKCDLALVATPTNGLSNGCLDMSIVEDVVSWLETPLILIKSALMPGTTDYLKKKYNKHIVVSVEMVGEGKYFIPYWKYPHPENPSYHDFLIIGGDKKDTSLAKDFLWEKMSPDINIHQLTAIEAEICKLMENTWGALKVTFANEMYNICKAWEADYSEVLQAWGADGRTEKMHMRVIPWKRGWKSKCWDKDIPALLACAKEKGYQSDFIQELINTNKKHLGK